MLDKSRFYYHTDYEFIWLSGDEEAPERERRMLAPPKVMRAVVWNPSGFHVGGVLQGA
jgi:hypothetical protein